MRVEKQPHGLRLAFEGSQNLFRKRLIEVPLDANLAAHRPGPADRTIRHVGNQPGNRFSRLRDNNLFAAGDPFDEPRKLCFGLVDIDLIHDLTKLSPLL